MLHQELPRIDATPLDGWERWLVPAIIAAAALTVALVLLLTGFRSIAAVALLAGAIASVLASRSSRTVPRTVEPLAAGGPDFTLVGSALGLSRDPVALTTSDGTLLVVNNAYRERFASASPSGVAANDEASEGLKLAQSMAWRDGAGCVAGIETIAGTSPVEVERAGTANDLLLWRFPEPPPPEPLSLAAKRMEGSIGERLAGAGVLGAVVDAKGAILAANSLFADRAIDPDQQLSKTHFRDLVEIGDDDQMRLLA